MEKSDIINSASMEIELAQEEFKRRQFELMNETALHVFDAEEQRNAATIEFILTVETILNEFQSLSSEEKTAALLFRRLHDAIEETIKRLVNVQKDRLQSRQQMIHEGELVDLNNELRDQRLIEVEHERREDFRQWVEFFNASLKVFAEEEEVNEEVEEAYEKLDISKILSTLKEQELHYQQALDKIIEHKSKAAMPIVALNEQYQQRMADIISRYQTLTEGTEFVQMCRAGRFDVIWGYSVLSLVGSSVTQEELDQGFYEACVAGHTSVIFHLLTRLPGDLGIAPNLLFQDSNGFTACHRIVEQGNRSVLEFLHRQWNQLGCQISLTKIQGGKKRTLLHTAAFFDQSEMITLLCSWKADVHAKEELTGGTPLHIAAWKGNLSAVKALFFVNADPRVKNDLGDDVLQTALWYEKTEILIFFSQQGYVLTDEQVDTLIHKSEDKRHQDLMSGIVLQVHQSRIEYFDQKYQSSTPPTNTAGLFQFVTSSGDTLDQKPSKKP